MVTLPAGAILANRYQIIRPLGRGGMGTLYLARDTRFERRYRRAQGEQHGCTGGHDHPQC